MGVPMIHTERNERRGICINVGGNRSIVYNSLDWENPTNGFPSARQKAARLY